MINDEVREGWKAYEDGDDFDPSKSEGWMSGWRQAQQFWFEA